MPKCDIFSPRERVMRQFRRQPVDRMPRTLDIGASPGVDTRYMEIFRSHTGSDDPATYFSYDIRSVSVNLTPQAEDFRSYYDSLPLGTVFDEFGVGHLESDEFPLGMEFHPWSKFSSPKQIVEYPFPTFEPSADLINAVRHWQSQEYAVSAASGSLNEWCYALRGMEEFFIDLVDRPEMADAILQRVWSLVLTIARTLSEFGVDVICMYGDMGSQDRLLFSPSLWERWFFPRWRSVVETVHRINPQALVLYHSCGAIEPIIPSIVKAGFDILNPVQPESMDPVAIKRCYGEEISLWGGIGMQSTMLKRNVRSVREDIVRVVESWAPGGGTIVTIAQTLLPDVPWENVEVLCATVEEVSRGIYAFS